MTVPDFVTRRRTTVLTPVEDLYVDLDDERSILVEEITLDEHRAEAGGYRRSVTLHGPRVRVDGEVGKRSSTATYQQGRSGIRALPPVIVAMVEHARPGWWLS